MGNNSPEKESSFKENQEDHNLQLDSVVQQSIRKYVKNENEQTIYQNLYAQCLNHPIKNRALGCLFGAFIGDSLGSYCEFSQTISQKLIDKVMTMPGGGTFSLKPGQLTDDSELAIHLLMALSSLNLSQQLQFQEYTLIKKIAQEYVNWLDSNPFDIGITCRKAINKLKNNIKSLKHLAQKDLPLPFTQIYQQIQHQNKDSESNGSLMRITPMAVLFSCTQNVPLLHEEFIKNQIKLTHPKEKIQTAGYIWVNLLARIIRRNDNHPATFQHILKEAEKLDKNKILQDWFEPTKQQNRMNGTINIGWAKIAFSYGMQELFKLTKTEQPPLDQRYYKSVIREIILEAGDTDTNASIVGGLLGALVGFSNLPPFYIKNMLQVKFSQNLQQQLEQSWRRPHYYEPFNVLLLSLKFIDNCWHSQQRQQPK